MSLDVVLADRGPCSRSISLGLEVLAARFRRVRCADRRHKHERSGRNTNHGPQTPKPGILSGTGTSSGRAIGPVGRFMYADRMGLRIARLILCGLLLLGFGASATPVLAQPGGVVVAVFPVEPLGMALSAGLQRSLTAYVSTSVAATPGYSVVPPSAARAGVGDRDSGRLRGSVRPENAGRRGQGRRGGGDRGHAGSSRSPTSVECR